MVDTVEYTNVSKFFLQETDFFVKGLERQFCKRLERQCLIGSALAGFNCAQTIAKASATGLDARQDDYNKGIWSPGNNPIR